MPTSDLDRYIAAQLLRADLYVIDTHFSKIGINEMDGIIFLKNLFLSLANLSDFERTVRVIYRTNRSLSSLFSVNQRNYEFAKYLRNKFVGHIHPELVEKAIEWKPGLRHFAARMDDQKIMFLTNIFVLETAINSYVDEDGKHKLFDSETDLMYPPDWDRFINYLAKSIRSAIQYLEDLCAVLNVNIDHPSSGQFDYELWENAGKTKFCFLRKTG